MTGKLVVLSSVVAAGAIGFVAGRRIGRRKSVKSILNGNHSILSKAELNLVQSLSDLGHGRLFMHWPPPGKRDVEKRQLLKAAAESLSTATSDLESLRLGVLSPPSPPQQPKVLIAYNDAREDPYYWMRDDARKDPQVLSHLEAENAYTSAVLADTEDLQEGLYLEMRGRIQEADVSAAVRHQGYYYYVRTEEGEQYKIQCRRRVPEEQRSRPPTETDVMDESIPEEVLLDENVAALPHSFYMTGGCSVSPNQQLFAWTEDTVGAETYTLRVKDLATGKEVTKPIPSTCGNVVWANDNSTLFYTVEDEMKRPYRVYRHVIGTGEADVLVHEEADESFYSHVSRSPSNQLLYLGCGSAVTSEDRVLRADDPKGEWRLVLPRVQDVEYSLHDRGDHFFIVHRDSDRPNSELRIAPIADPTAHKVLLPHRPDVKLEGVVVSEDYLVVFEREGALQHATVHPLPPNGAPPSALQEGRKVVFDEPAYELEAGSQGDFSSPLLRLRYTSLTTPPSTIDHHMATSASCTKKVQVVLGDFVKERYETQRLWAVAPDGTRVPLSVVFRRDLVKLDGSDPCLLDGYGSYEVSNDPYFSSSRLSLLDRGFVFAIAHVRGGGEMGRRWYEDGKFAKKVNTFTDFVACAEHLVANKYCSPGTLCISGRSAGGLLMGAVLNLRPDLFQSAIMGVPFVDALTTISDPTLPLTVMEWEEWGNPTESEEMYRCIKAYSPVDNVRTQRYPHILAIGGLHDPRVGYWEPAKFVAKVRDMKVGDELVLLKCQMGAGHFSKSGRFEALREVALEYAFLLKTIKMPAASSSSSSKL